MTIAPPLRGQASAIVLASLAGLALLANAFLTVVNVRKMAAANAWVGHTHEVLEAVLALRSSLQDAETGERGYVITGEDAYLDPYRSGFAATERHLADLESLTRDNPDHLRAIAAFRPLVRAKLEELEETVRLRRGRDGARAARAAVLTDRGKRLMDDVSAFAEAMFAHETTLLAERDQRSAAAARTAIATGPFGFGASLALLAGAFELFRRRVREREEAADALRAEKERFRTTLHSIGDAVIVTDARGRIAMLNPTAGALLGWDEPADGRPLDEVFRIVDEETRAPVESPLAKVMRTGKVAGLENHTVLIRRDGVDLPIDDSGAPIRDARGEMIGIVLVFRDMSERRRAERELQSKNALLEAQDRRKDEFLAVLSHELRNPLAPLRNAITVLLRADPAGPQAHRAREVIDRQVAQLSRLVEDLLDTARIAEGKIRLDKQPMSLKDAVRRTVDDHRSLFQARRVAVEVHEAPEPIWVEADAARIVQVVGNLLQNAAKFTNPGGHVAVGLSTADGHAIVRVRDDGAGMDPATLRAIFQPFMQAESTLARTQGGLGLGLALAKNFVELHGGSIGASSEGVGRGTEFVVSLPLARNVVVRPAAARVADRSPLRILIVDDDDAAATVLRDVLELDGHRVAVAPDGGRGVEAALAEPPDVVLCDLELPDIDGFEVARRLRAAGSRTRLVALTGYSGPEDAARARAAGFDDHLAKPADPERIATILGSAASPMPE